MHCEVDERCFNGIYQGLLILSFGCSVLGGQVKGTTQIVDENEWTQYTNLQELAPRRSNSKYNTVVIDITLYQIKGITVNVEPWTLHRDALPYSDVCEEELSSRLSDHSSLWFQFQSCWQ